MWLNSLPVTVFYQLMRPEPKQTCHFTANHVQTSLISHTDSASPVCRPQARTLERNQIRTCVFGEWQANVELTLLHVAWWQGTWRCVCAIVLTCRMLYVCVLKGSARSVSFNYTTKPSCQHVHTHRVKRAWCQSMSRYRWSVCGLPQRHTARLCGAANDVWKLARKMTFFLMESMYWAMLCHLFLSRSFIYLLHWQHIYNTHAYWNYWKDTCYLIRKILKVWR